MQRQGRPVDTTVQLLYVLTHNDSSVTFGTCLISSFNFICCINFSTQALATKQVKGFVLIVTGERTSYSSALRSAQPSVFHLLALRTLPHQCFFFNLWQWKALQLSGFYKRKILTVPLRHFAMATVKQKPDLETGRYLMKLTHLPPNGQRWEVQSITMTDSRQKFSVA